jgi:hypothetical protein
MRSIYAYRENVVKYSECIYTKSRWKEIIDI